MNKFEEKIEIYTEELNRLGVTYDLDLLKSVAKGLGPSIYKVDAGIVSGSDEKELETVKNNFLVNKLGLRDNGTLDKAIADVMQIMGKSNRNKHRVIVYYLLVKELNQEKFYQ